MWGSERILDGAMTEQGWIIEKTQDSTGRSQAHTLNKNIKERYIRRNEVQIIIKEFKNFQADPPGSFLSCTKH